MYRSLDEIMPHNNQLGVREIDMLISIIAKKPLNDQVRLDVINEALHNFGGTVADALVERIYNSQ